MSAAAHDLPQVPVVDVGGLRSNRRSDLEALAFAIGAAARKTGFFSIVNHGVSPDLIADVFAQARTFFALTRDEKERLSIERSPVFRGYAHTGYEQFDANHPADAKESFDVGPDLAPDDPEVLAGKPFHGPNLWPELPRFRAVMLAYYAALKELLIDLHRAVAIDLGADEHYFTSRLDRALAIQRLLFYPPHPGIFDGKLYGAAPHTDYGNITLLAQDDAGGLELQMRDGRWIDVDPVPGAFVCNVGDCLMRWSNDVYVSNRHRVVNRSGRPRYSVAFFGDPNPDAVIACLPSCTSPATPAHYAPVEYATYLHQRLAAAYPERSAARSVHPTSQT